MPALRMTKTLLDQSLHLMVCGGMLWIDRRDDPGPFDIIGDVHGCADELETLLTRFGYRIEWRSNGRERTVCITPPPDRKAIFVGDLVDRGPNSPDVLRIAMTMAAAGTAYVVEGNHEHKLGRWLEGRNVTIGGGLERTIDQLAAETPDFRRAVLNFLRGLSNYIWLDGGRLAVAHAGLREDMLGRSSGGVKAFTLYGKTTGEVDAFGLPVRINWMADYRGATTIVYGHTPVAEAERINNTLCIDTGCVFGGKLTALRWPENELVDVPAEQVWFQPTRPLGSLRG